MYRNVVAVVGFVVALVTVGSPAMADPCVGNPIAVENCLTGAPPSEWDVSGAGDESIQGFATDISVNRGETVHFKISTDATAYRLDIYRLGYYQGNGARKVATAFPSVTLPQAQPSCLTDPGTLLTDCGNWSESASWTVPTEAVSGIYIARLVRTDTGGASHVAFVVRYDASGSDLLFKTSDTTWQAYNSWGGYSLYVGPARKVSYNRPFFTRGYSTEDWLFNAEYPMVRWLEANGYDVSYTTDLDTDKYTTVGPNRILSHRAFLSVGHDEYWSAGERAAVEAAREAGVHLAFFSGNESYWKIRWEPSTDPSNTPYRTQVCYKEGTMGENTCGSKCDPLPGVWTGLWRSGCPPEYPGTDGCRPENALSGNISWVGSTSAIQVPQTYGSLRFWRNTSIAALPAGQVATLTGGTLGYEWDFEQYMDFYPPGRIAMSETILGGQTHHLSLYRYYSGGVRKGLVFGAGTVQWSWGLDGNHDRGASTPDVRIQQGTVNLFADMGVQPATLQPPLYAAAASTDVTAPTSSIDSPLSGSTVQINVPITVSGLASDTGGVVGVVEVSVDGGTTWRRATGRETWSYGWTPSAYGAVTIKSRATDDSGNIETPGPGVTVTVGDTPSGPPHVPVANSDYYTTARNVPLTIAAPGVLGNDTDPDSDPLTAVLRTSTTYGTLALGADGGFTYTPAQDWAGNDAFTYRAKDPSDNLSAVATVTIGVSQTCPCTIFLPTYEPVSPWESDPSPIELGVRWRSDVDGYVTAVRFYKHAQNTGTHIAHLWTAAGALLASETFTGESASDWQEVTLSNPVQITAGSTYIASYHSSTGYAQDTNVFGGAGVDSPPLHALQDGLAGPNGVYTYCATPGCFPTSGYVSSNYYADVVFVLSVGPDETPPTVTSVAPINGAINVVVGSNVSASFSEAIDPATIDGTTCELRDGSNNLIPATVTYSVAARQAVLDPSAPLAYETTYTATIKGGLSDPRVKDLAGNALASNYVWSFTTGSPPPPGPEEGPGGPILVIASSANPFGRYFAEILRTEGLNYFTATDIQNVTPTVLAEHRVVILGEMSLNSAQVTMLTDWVNGGGRLVAMRPDKQLAGLLGLTDAGATVANKYLLIDTSGDPGAGLVSQTIQFHGAADLYTLNGATALATLYSDATTPTTYPALTLRAVGGGGGGGGYAVAFTYDLARSVVYTRQGNPAWVGQDRDGRGFRAQDMFYGAASGDVQPDWIDLNKVAIPQADEQQRLLAKLIQRMDGMPLPRFWYFPRMKKAIVIMTGDDEGSGQTPGRWDHYIAQSPAGCSVADWECVRGSSYIIGISGTDAQALYYTNLGFELGVHVNTGCAGWTPSQLENYYSTQLAAFQAAFPSIPAPASERTHCIAWSDWDTNAHVQATHNIRLDTNYYYWPPEWVQNRPGYFTGSGMMMRFADLDGTMVDNYQSATQIPDESGLSLPYAIDAMLDKALGQEGYYGAIDCNMHTTSAGHSGSDAIVASAQARGIPVVSGRQMAEWLDGRNGSKFGDMTWDGNVLGFSVTAASGARNLKGMVPRISSVGALTGITRGGTPIPYTTETIKAVEYAIFDATSGVYAASYAVDNTPPVITNVSAAPGFGGTALITWDTSTEASDSRVDFGTAPGSLTGSAADPSLVTLHSITLTGLLPNTTYYYRVTSKDAFNNASTYPPADPPLSFTTPSAAFQETTAADFSAGTTGACSYVSETADGEVILAPSEGSEFSGTTIPAGWTATPWTTGGTATVAGGKVRLSAARVRTDTLYPAGRVLEFVATFSGAPNQHAGFGIDLTSSAWAIFSTMGGGGLWARSNVPTTIETAIPGSWLGAPHRFRIEWTTSSVTYFIDGTQAASHTIAIVSNMGPMASDLVAGDGDLIVDWMRMSPYPASCSYVSRVLDAGRLATWGAVSWTSEAPAGTSLAMYVRLGNTPVPDGTWTGWAEVPSSGSTIGGESQYLQYQADLATTDSGATPALKDVTIGYNIGPDTTPPTITGRSPSPGTVGVDATANVVVQFSESMDATTINTSTITLRAVGARSDDVPATVTLSGATATLDPTGPLSPGQEYRATVAGTVADLSGNPLGADDTWTFTVYLDVIPPTITGRSPAPGTMNADPASNVVVQFSEAMDAATITASTLSLRQVGAGADVPAVVSCSGATATLDPVASLLPGADYRVTVSGSVADLTGNPLGADDTWTFGTMATESMSDSTAADFGAGSPSACSIVAHTGDGELTLSPTLGEEFSGTSLPSGWDSYIWPGQSGSVAVSGGWVVVDGARANPYDGTPTPDGPRYGPGRSLEFVATFAAVPGQHAGFAAGNQLPAGEIFNTTPWAIFSTGMAGTALQARTVVGVENNFTIPGSWLGAPHRYRIDWNASSVDFYIDGNPVYTSTDAISTSMRPAVADYYAGGGNLSVDWMRMSDYASPCAFESRIFDGGFVTDWVSLTATGSLPTGTSYTFETRTGNAAAPDGTWSAWTPVSGTAIASPDGRYLQYRAALSTTDSRATPELQRVEIVHSLVPDTTSPTITGRAPAPDATGVDLNASVTVQFSEIMNPATINGTTVTLRAIGAGSDVPATVTYAGVTAVLDPTDPLALGTTYRVTVSGSVADPSGNTLGSDDTWTFTTSAAVSVADTTVTDFGGGSRDGCSTVAHTGDGELTLSPTIGEEFSGTELPGGWASYNWSTGGSYTVSGGAIAVDGARVDPDPAAYGPGRSVEFVATFAATPYQHVGWGAGNHSTSPQIFNNAPWAMFGTGTAGTALQARVYNLGPLNDYTIPGSWLGAAHLYRVDWSPTGFDFYIDGALVHSWTETIAGPMRPAISDYTVGGPAVTVDWLRMSDYGSPCAFESRIFDGGFVVDWASLTGTGGLPAGTSYTFETRSGNTPVPDGTWSAWAPVSGTTIASPDAKYLQYRATLSTTDARVSPELQRVDIVYDILPDNTPPTITGRTPAPGAIDVDANSNVLVQFSEPMDPATVNTSTVRLRDVVAGIDVAAAVTSYGTTATLDPIAPLLPGREYRVTVSSTVADLRGNPLGADDAWTFRVFIDLVPPTITGRSPAPGSTGVDVNSNVTVQFSEAMNPSTIDSTTVRLRATGAGSDVPAVVTYSGLTATLDPVAPLSVATAYHVTVSGSVTDLQGNPLGADDTWTFTTIFPQAMADTSSADFLAGTPGACSIVAHTGDGEVTLMPTISEEFSGTDLPTGWASYDWPYDGLTGSVSVSGGSVTVNGMRVDPDPAAYGAGRSLEFVATFATAEGYQHVGFGAGDHTPPTDIFNNPPQWTIFSTNGGGVLQARTWSGAGNIDLTISGSWLGAPHRYKIVWTASNATYFIDGTQVASQAFSGSYTMRPAISDLYQNTGSLSVDWMRMSPYGSPCAFESRVFDSGKLVHWSSLTATGSLPSGTGYVFETRSGNSLVPDGSWSAWAPVTGTAIASPNARYLQYRATLFSTDDGVTPELQRVDITVDACVPEVCNGLDDDCDGATDEGLGSTTCGVGACQRTVENCAGGVPQTCTPGAPGTETCNGLDDDCDGVVDNGGTTLCNDNDACTDDACTSGQCVHSGICGVSGTVFYYRDASGGGSEPSVKPVPNVGIGGSGTGTTDVDGAYVVGGLYGNVTITPVGRYGDTDGAISSLDAARVAMAAVGRETLSANQTLAGDVTGNGTLSALDASWVARFSAQLVSRFPAATTSGSDWRFVPASYSVTLIGHDEAGKDFLAILYGDVTGDWTPSGRAVARVAGGTSAEEQAARARDLEVAERFKREGMPLPIERRPGAGPATLSLSGWKALRAGERRQLTVVLRNADGILGLDLRLEYDPSRVAIREVETAGIASRMSLARADGIGTCRIAEYGFEPLSGSGTVLTITVEALRGTGNESPLSASGVANEGGIPLRVRGRGQTPPTRR
jgi:hypothetical protein